MSCNFHFTVGVQAVSLLRGPTAACFIRHKRSCRIHVAAAIVVLREGANKERVMAKKKKKNSKSKT